MKNTARVLIVDDDKSSAQVLAEVIKRMGLKPIVVNKPTEALNLVRLQTIHAAIVDVLLPKMSGVDLVLEFRDTKFADSPVVLVSGVFKDKNFSAEAIKKTGAVDFLFKPFGAEELINSLNVAFKEALDSQRLNIAGLLSRRFPSARERIKAIEQLEPIHGNDFIYVLSLLMTAKVTGYFNIVNEIGEIFGVNLLKGSITGVDSTESQSAGVLALINKGYLSQQDWEEFQSSGHKKFTLERLVQEGFVSPHGVALATHEQILADLKTICSAEQLRLNFNPIDSEDVLPPHAVELSELLDLILEAGDEFFKAGYFVGFYAGVLNAPIRMRSDNIKFEGLKDGLAQIIRRGGTLAEALAESSTTADEIYRSLHFLVLKQDIIFADMGRVKDLSAAIDRYTKIFEDLSGHTPDQVFEYFGAGEMASTKSVENIFEEYVKNNHPDRLPKESSAELKTICKKCFDIVKSARDVMMSETLRAELISRKKTEGLERQKKASELLTKGLNLLRKGQFSEALETIKESEELHSSTVQYFIRVWAEIKTNKNITKQWLFNTMKHMDALPADDRRSAFYFMAMGLVKKALSDGTAIGFFEKAIAADSTFVEARRELTALDNQELSKDKKVDILTGDITEVISQLFRRKAD